MQNARSTAAISRASSEGYHFSHDALVTCKLPIVKDSINWAGKYQSSSLTNSPTVRTRNMAEAEDNSIPPSPPVTTNK
jgi:hypothetical protein